MNLGQKTDGRGGLQVRRTTSLRKGSHVLAEATLSVFLQDIKHKHHFNNVDGNDYCFRPEATLFWIKSLFMGILFLRKHDVSHGTMM